MTNIYRVEGCFSCEQTAQGTAMPIRERVYDDGMWRVAHAFNSALLGWLVIVPHRHITTIAALTPDEAVTLGRLQVQLCRRLKSL